jgi:prepilin signal peptidase PulO-like enzyme (type II secretory pathway)
MVDLINLFIWSLIVFSATNIVVVSKMFQGLRMWLSFSEIKTITDNEGKESQVGIPRKIKFFSNLIHCSMCMGFWFGVIFGAFVFSPTFNILLGDYMFVNYFADGLLGSIFSWIYYLIIRKHQTSL